MNVDELNWTPGRVVHGVIGDGPGTGGAIRVVAIDAATGTIHAEAVPLTTQPSPCERCYNRGWYPHCDDNGDEVGEKYCDCPAGQARMERECPPGPPMTGLVTLTPEAVASNMAAVALAFDAPIIPIATARKPRTAKWLRAEIHNRDIRMHFDHGKTPSSKQWAELKQGDRVIARDPMPTVMMVGLHRELVPRGVEVPGPNCLDVLSATLGLTDEERALFRVRAEDVPALVAEAAEEMRNALEAPP